MDIIRGRYPSAVSDEKWARRWLAAGCFDALLDDLRAMLRQALAARRNRVLSSSTPAPCVPRRIAASVWATTWQAQERLDSAYRGDTLGTLLALRVTAANVDERAELSHLTQPVHAVTDDNVDAAFADQGYTGTSAAEAAAANGIELVVIKPPYAKKGFVQLARRWVVERTLTWAIGFRRLVRDYKSADLCLVRLERVGCGSARSH